MKISKIWLIPLVAFIASCSSSKQEMPYFTNIDTMPVIELQDYQVKIEPSDELLITVTSESPGVTSTYNLPMTNPATRGSIVTPTSPQQQTYTVTPEGYINFPVLGMIYVEGLTVDQLRDKLVAEISKVAKDPIVTVNLVSFFVNVGGEVARPGHYGVSGPRQTIIDALTRAGDLTQYGRRDNVLLVREEDGKLKHVRLNLNSAELMSSPYYFLKQNDYIYVEPNDIRKDNAEYSQYNSYKLSVVSTIVSGCASVISLIIALTR